MAKNPRSTQNRYSEEWIVKCLVIYMKGPTSYLLIRDLQIVPFPCKSTITKYLRLCKSNNVFDARHLELLRKKMELMTQKDGRFQYGVICLDEIHVRTALSVNTKNNTFGGLVDYELEVPKHALETVFVSKKINTITPLCPIEEELRDEYVEDSEEELEDALEKRRKSVLCPLFYVVLPVR